MKNFHRGLELFGQHRLRDAAVREQIAKLGLIVVEGPNDVIALDGLGVPAVDGRVAIEAQHDVSTAFPESAARPGTHA